MEKDKPKIGRGQRLLELAKNLPPQPSTDVRISAISSSQSITNIPETSAFKGSGDFEDVNPMLKPKIGGRGNYAALLMKSAELIKNQEKEELTKSTPGRGLALGTQHLPEFGFEPAANLAVSAIENLKIESKSTLENLQVPKFQERGVRSKFHHMATVRENDPPPVMKPGKDGKLVDVLVNYIPLRCKTEGVCQYATLFDPPVDDAFMRKKLIKSLESSIGLVYVYDGTVLFLPKKLNMETVLKTTRPTDGIEITVIIKLTRIVPMASCMQLYNLIFKKIMIHLQMVKIGYNYFMPSGTIMIPKQKLEIWPGYITAIEEYEGGVLLCADVSHRVLRQQTCLDLMEMEYERNKSSYREACTRSLVGNMVLTKYNNKTYRIDDIDWEHNVSTKFQIGNQEMTLMEYYKTQYNITIKNINQPLLINIPSKKEQRNFPQKRAPLDKISLVPELSYMTGLTDDMRSDYSVMKILGDHTRLTPQIRVDKLLKFINNVENTPEAKKELEKWGFELDTSLIQLQARELPTESVWAGNPGKALQNQNADWSRDLSRVQCLLPIPINNWLLVYTKKDHVVVESFVKYLRDMADRMGIMIANGDFQAINNDRIDSYLDALKNKITNQTQIVVTVFPSSRDDRYNAIKNFCLVTKGVASQVIITRTIANTKKIGGVSQKIALQMNCKLKGQLWRVHLPPKRTMICGVDTYHDPSRKRGSCVGFVSSTNQICTEWFSKTWFQNPGEELAHGLCILFTDALRKYHECNKELPTRILLYRDGVGDGQLRSVQTYEVEQLKKCFDTFGPNYEPKLAVIIVQKRINTRIMLIKHMSGDLDNPTPGTVLDHSVTRRNWYDFFIVSQRIMQGTVSPTHYIVVYDDINWTPDQMQSITYKLTHMYYNWPGTVRVPAPCQYAHKLAYLIGQNVRKEVHPALVDRLYFL